MINVGSDNRRVNRKIYIGSRAMMVLAVFFVLAPMYIMFATSIMSKYEANGAQFRVWPKQGVTFESYRTVLFESVGGLSVVRGLFNTIWMYVPSILVDVLISTMAAFAFAKMKFKAKNFMFSVLLATMMIPNSMGLITAYLVYDTLGWVGTALPIMVPKMFGEIGAVFFLRQFYMKVPDDLIGCARMDGLGYFGTFIRIMLPIAVPAMSAQFILLFIAGYNDYTGPLLYLPNARMATLQLVLAQFGDVEQIQNWPLRMAASAVSMAPLIVLYLASQRLMLKGLEVSTGFKG